MFYTSQYSSDLPVSNEAFISSAKAQYGYRGMRQAEDIIRQLNLQAQSTKYTPADLSFVRDALIQTFWDAKKYNQRFRNHRYEAAQ